MKFSSQNILLWIHVALCVSLALAQDVHRLREELEAAGVSTLFQNDTGYEDASKAFNMRFTVAPLAITFPTSPHQVSRVVKAGAAQNIRVTARSGGHSYIANGLGYKDGALVVDLSRMTNITYDSANGHASIETGLRLGDIALALNEHGRGLPHGRCSYVGIGGHAGFGGYGVASRMWGLTLDTVKAATVVLANGSITTVSQEVQPDLFWAIRGASASFGIVTSFEFGSLPVPPVATYFMYVWALDADEAASALSDWQDIADSLPVVFGGELGFGQNAPGTILGVFFGEFFGSAADFNSTVKTFVDGRPAPLSVNISSGTWIEGLVANEVNPLNTSTAPDTPYTFYIKSLMTPESEPMTPEAITAFTGYLVNEGYNSNSTWFIEIELFGGKGSAINAVPADATAFAHRNVRFNIQMQTLSLDGPLPETHIAYITSVYSTLVDTMPKDWDYGAYANYLDDRLPDWQRLYYGSHYDRLKVLKASVDPNNVFHFPTSIEE